MRRRTRLRLGSTAGGPCTRVMRSITGRTTRTRCRSASRLRRRRRCLATTSNRGRRCRPRGERHRRTRGVGWIRDARRRGRLLPLPAGGGDRERRRLLGGWCEGGGEKTLNGSGEATSDATTLTTTVGKYCWRAVYSGDTVYNGGSHTNGTTSASRSVRRRRCWRRRRLRRVVGLCLVRQSPTDLRRRVDSGRLVARSISSSVSRVRLRLVGVRVRPGRRWGRRRR